MRPIGLDDILGRDRYGAEREAIRRRVIDHKRVRRVAVGDRLSLVFEDRATVWYQIQEMLWVERIVDLDAIRAELDTYNPLLPGGDDLSGTLLIELADQSHIREEFERLLGLDRYVALVVDGLRVPATFEAGRQTEDKISAVQYVRFPIDGRTHRALAARAPVQVVADHPNYAAATTLPEPVRASVVSEFLDEGAADAALRRVRDCVA